MQAHIMVSVHVPTGGLRSRLTDDLELLALLHDVGLEPGTPKLCLEGTGRYRRSPAWTFTTAGKGCSVNEDDCGHRCAGAGRLQVLQPRRVG